MLIYTVLLCAIVVIAYLIQFQLYSHSRSKVSGTDVFDIIGLPIESGLNFGAAAEEHPAK